MDELKLAKALEEFLNTKRGPSGLNDAFEELGDAFDAAVKEAYAVGYRDGYAEGDRIKYTELPAHKCPVPPSFRELLLAVRQDAMGAAVCNPVGGKDWFKARHELLFGPGLANENNRLIKVIYLGDSPSIPRGKVDAYLRDDKSVLIFAHTGWYGVPVEDCEIVEDV